MILRGKSVELIPFFGYDDWEYTFKLAKKHDKRLTEEMIVREAMDEGVQFYVGYVDGKRSGVVFSKHYRDGLTLDAYSELHFSALYSLEAAHLMLAHLLKFVPIVYVRIEHSDNKLHRLCKAIGLKWDHAEGGRDVYSQKRQDYSTYSYDSVNTLHESTY